MFQLKARLQKVHQTVSRAQNNGVPFPANEDPTPTAEDDTSSTSDPDEAEVVVDEHGEVLDQECSEKPAEGLRKAFARFGRRRTHNEELCVASCGVILGRATFYGAEGPNSVRVSTLLGFKHY